MPPGMGAGPHLEGLLDQHHIGAGTEFGARLGRRAFHPTLTRYWPLLLTMGRRAVET